ncbi:MAG: class I SAM-dependent methyltransferase [Candidatus Omnitrophota bacterium]
MKKIYIILNYLLQFLSCPISAHKKFIRKEIVKEININLKKNILDFGCGHGIFSGLFKNTNINYIELDCDLNSLLFAKYIHQNNLYLCAGELLCFKQNIFDYIILNNVLHHMDKKSIIKLFDEIIRVLKNKRKVIIIELLPFEKQRGFFLKIVTSLEKKIKKISYVSDDFLTEIAKKYFRNIKKLEVSRNFISYILEN